MTGSLGPVSQTLLDELKEKMGERPVVWLDKGQHYTEFFDGLGDDTKLLGGHLVGYRGSYLELMSALAPLTSGADPSPFLLHVPGTSKETIKDTPLLQIYEFGQVYERALDTLVRNAAAGRVPPEDVDQFLAQGSVTLAQADAWMAERTASASDTWTNFLRKTQPGPLILALLGRSNTPQLLSKEVRDQLPASLVRHHFATHLGLPDGWGEPPGSSDETLRELAESVAEWVMAVEYVFDLRRPPKVELLEPATRLSRPLIEACQEATRHLREQAPHEYQVLAQDFEGRLARERDEGSADELGRIDTFSFEEDRLMQAALDALLEGSWDRAATWARDRLEGKSVWLQLDRSRHKTWTLLQRCAQLGQALEKSATETSLRFDTLHSLDEATEAYAAHGAAIDRLHRELEQAAALDLLEDLPHRDRVQQAVAAARGAWRDWAEARARSWSELSRREGALPTDKRQQRNIFDQVVEPMLRQDGKTAYFVVDALRYEMALELLELIGKPSATRVHLDARLCELPAVTEVGMNVLAPMAKHGRLIPKIHKDGRRIKAWKGGEIEVSTPEGRKKAMDARVSSAQCKWLDLEKVIAVDTAAKLKRMVRDASLVVVHSTQIDKAGEHGSGLSEFSRELRRLDLARQRLHAAGVHRFVITSDHGFLMRSVREEGLTFGKHHDSKGRYALYGHAYENEDTYSVSLRSLEYEDVGDQVLIFPRGLSVYKSAETRDYVHGGNSPQERVIPVLTVEHKTEQGSADEHFRVKLVRQVADGDKHTIEARIERVDNQISLALKADPVPLELRPHAAKGVTAELSEAEGARIEGGMLIAEVDKTFKVRFRLTGSREQRVPVELICATGRVRVDEVVTPTRFDVLVPRTTRPAPPKDDTAATPPKGATTDKAEPPSDESWLEVYDDPNIRKVMLHIATHGEVTEADLLMLLDKGRLVRSFARRYEEYAAQAPFRIKIEMTAAGKTYRKLTDA